MGPSRRQQLWGIAFVCAFLLAGVAKAAEPILLKEIACVKGHHPVKAGDVAVSVEDAAFSPDGKKAATVAWNGTVKVWEIPTLKELSHFEVDPDLFPRIALAWSPDGRFLAICGNKSSVGPDGKLRRLEHYGTVWVWRPEGKLRRTIRHTGPVFRVFFRPDGSALSTGLGPTLFWSAQDDKEPISIPEITMGPLDPVWDLSNRQRQKRGLPPIEWDANDFALSPDSQRAIICASRRGEFTNPGMALWDLKARKELTRQPLHAFRAAFSPDGRRVAATVLHVRSGPRPLHVELWDSKLSKMRWRSAGYGGVASRPVFSPDGELILSTGLGGRFSDRLVVRLWKTGTGDEVGDFALAYPTKRDERDINIKTLAVSPDGKLLLGGTGGGYVVLCQLPSPPVSDKPEEKKP
jgi:WD40 repeat protein